MPQPAQVDTADARARGENFPVALRVLPRAVRTHLLAVYGFARLTDDLGDEGPALPAERLQALDRLEVELHRIFDASFDPSSSNPSSLNPSSSNPSSPADAQHPDFGPVLARLAPTIRACSLPEEPFRRLIEANRIDQRVDRYPTWADLRDYCTYSADPVGRLVLGVFGASTPERERLSDDVCTALQLIEHVQDVGEDRTRGRVYLPAEDLARFGCDDRDLRATSASLALRRVVVFESDRARVLLRAGTALAGDLRGGARLAVAGFTAGGLATLDAFHAAGHDVMSATARPSKSGVVRHLGRVLARARGGAPGARAAEVERAA